LTALIQISEARSLPAQIDCVEELQGFPGVFDAAREHTMYKRLAVTSLTLLILVGSVGLLGACNTTAGAGKDMSAAGTAIENSAEKNKSY
jgi:predicted small secreted protein